tara:strand:- start:280 stop:2364 length:2085 start_codon:yes stop_codon:yes gene_type:complete
MKIRPLIVLSEFWAIILLLNHASIQSAWLGAFVLLLYVTSTSLIVKRRLFPLVRSVMGFTLGLLGALSVFIIVASLIYYGASWSTLAMGMTLMAIPLLLGLLPKQTHTFVKEPQVISLHFSTSGHSFFGLFVLALQLILFSAVIRSSVSHAIISPWEALPSYFFPLFVVTTFLLALHYLLYRHKTHFFLGFLHVVMMLGIAFMVFPNGYGFDPFIHRAAESHILENDVIEPKTPYYIGQYMTVVTGARLVSPAVLSLLDRLLVPLLAALILLASSVYSLRRLGFDLGVALSGLMLFLLPFSSFIVTTPQGLANTIFAALVILSLTMITDRPIPRVYLWVLGLATFLIHPLTGVPALIFVLLLRIWNSGMAASVRGILMSFVYAAACVILPALLLFSSKGISGLSEQLSNISLPSFAWGLSWLRPLDPTLDILYTYRFFLVFMVLGIFAYGVKLALSQSRFKGIVGILTGLFIVLVVNASLLASGMQLPLVIDYEQGNYSIRVMEIALIVLFPILLLLSQRVFHRLYHAESIVRIIGLGMISVAMAGGLYFSYPRNNPVERAHGYSVATADFDTVSEIEKDADGASYVVLANQAVSAAAIQSVGFDRYVETVDGEQYFYPIPTGGQLYEYFLTMIYGEPTQQVANAVMSYMNVDRVYFVVNDYWWDSENIVQLALANSSDSFQLDWTNKVFVFSK